MGQGLRGGLREGVCGMRLIVLGVIAGAVLGLTSLIAQAQLRCPPMPDKVTEVNHDVRTDVNGSVGTLGKLKAGQVGAKVDVEAKNLFEKYPNTDRILIAQMMSATYCDMIRDSKTLKDSERLRLWSEFSDRIFKYENPTTNPPSPKSPHKGAADKGPITVNNSPGTAVSVGQKGGITAGVVNIGVLERNLTDK